MITCGISYVTEWLHVILLINNHRENWDSRDIDLIRLKFDLIKTVNSCAALFISLNSLFQFFQVITIKNSSGREIRTPQQPNVSSVRSLCSNKNLLSKLRSLDYLIKLFNNIWNEQSRWKRWLAYFGAFLA